MGTKELDGKVHNYLEKIASAGGFSTGSFDNVEIIVNSCGGTANNIWHVAFPSDAQLLPRELVYGTEDTDEINVGRVFPNREAFKQHMAGYALTRKFSYRHARSCPKLMILKCSSPSCPWRVYAIKMNNSECYQVRRVVLVHQCSVDTRSKFQAQATTAVIGEMMRSRYIGVGRGLRPNELRQVMRTDHDVHISYWKAWRSREVAMDNAKGSAKGSYTLLPSYLQQLMKSNPQSVVALETNYDEKLGQRFRYLFVALEGSIKGYPYMRKVIVVDGTHLKGKFAGCLLTASCQDGNYQIFPLAFAIVDSENDNAWECFFGKLSEIVADSGELVFVSDRHSSIYDGLNTVYPMAGHCACLVHLQRNIKTIFKTKHLSYLLSRAARAFHVDSFYTAFNEFKRMDIACANYLVGIGLEHWARSHFSGSRYNIMTSNIAESWNAVLHEAREFPIISLVEYIRTTLMSWFAVRREAAEGATSSITPKAQELVTKNFEASTGYDVYYINTGEYEVRDKIGLSYHVNVVMKTCSCLEFQMLCIPCPHAVAAAVRAEVPVDSLVAPEYSSYFWKMTYATNINPVSNLKTAVNVVDALNSLHLHPPATRWPPGRPRKRRFLSRGEFMRPVRKRVVLCSRCHGAGHSRARCKQAI